MRYIKLFESFSDFSKNNDSGFTNLSIEDFTNLVKYGRIPLSIKDISFIENLISSMGCINIDLAVSNTTPNWNIFHYMISSKSKEDFKAELEVVKFEDDWFIIVTDFSTMIYRNKLDDCLEKTDRIEKIDGVTSICTMHSLCDQYYGLKNCIEHQIRILEAI